LKESQTLKHISILFASQWLEDRIAARNCAITLKGFRNLTSLEVYHFYGDKARISKDLVSALEDSPHLQTLGLALAIDCDCEQFPEAVILEDEIDFFEKLCAEYGSRKTTSPLPLKTLKLGHGMCLFQSASTIIENYLAKLVKISGLRTLHIFNGLMKMDIDDEAESMQVEWSLFKDCTSLHQLSVTRLEDDVRQWLNTVGNSVQELIVTDHIGIYDPILENFNALNLPHLSMLFTAEEFSSKPDSEDEWSDTDSFDSQFDSDHSRSDSQFGSESGSSEEESEDAADTDSEAASSLHVDRSIRTVLDRLHDGGSKLTRLCLELEFETQWVRSIPPSCRKALTIAGSILLPFVENAVSKPITHMPQDFRNYSRTVSDERVIALANGQKAEGYSIPLRQANERDMPLITIYQDTRLDLGICSATQVQTVFQRSNGSRARIR
jgi:hypothetical protein